MSQQNFNETDIDSAVERSRARDVDLANIDCDEKTLSEMMDDVSPDDIFMHSADYLMAGLDALHIAHLWVTVKGAAHAEERGDTKIYWRFCDRAMKLLFKSVEESLR